jgi:hypothetical protein
MMEKENKITTAYLPEAYEAPVIEIIEVRVEQGFNCSGSLGGNPNDSDDPDGSF